MEPINELSGDDFSDFSDLSDVEEQPSPKKQKIKHKKWDSDAEDEEDDKCNDDIEYIIIEGGCVKTIHGIGVVVMATRKGVATVRLYESNETVTITKGADGGWPCHRATHPHQHKWSMYVTMYGKLIDGSGQSPIDLVKEILKFVQNHKSFQYCADRSTYFENKGQPAAAKKWDANAQTLEAHNIELLEDYAASYEKGADPATLSSFLEQLEEDDAPLPFDNEHLDQ